MKLYSDMSNVAESLGVAARWFDSGRLVVLDAGQAVIVAEDGAKMKARNLWSAIDDIDDVVCVIEWTVTEIGSHTATRFELFFHESEVDGRLQVRPAGPDVIDAKQATSPTELGPRLNEALSPLTKDHDAIFTFKGVKAASIANAGHYTDFEYEYSIDGVSG